MSDALRLRNGHDNVLANCDIAHVASAGILVSNGHRHRILSNNIRETGGVGIGASGGVKATLEPCSHEVLNNDVSRAGNDFPVPAVRVGVGGASEILRDAVGLRVANNRVHDTANAGIAFGGAENVVEFNEVG